MRTALKIFLMVGAFIAAAAMMLVYGISNAYGQGFDVSGWDRADIWARDANKREHYYFHQDTWSEDVAVSTWAVVFKDREMLSSYLVKSINGDCFIGRPSFTSGKSAVRYVPMPCGRFNRLYKVYMDARGKLLKSEGARPLEKI